MNTTNTTVTNGTKINIDQKKLEESKTGFRGGVLSPDTHGYDQARKMKWHVRQKTGAYRQMRWNQ